MKPFLLLFLTANLFFFSFTPNFTQQKPYSCIPCGYDCDKEQFDKPGKCPHCQMELVLRSTIRFKSIEPSEICNYIKLNPGVLLLDVRTKEEYDGKAEPNFGTLKNAINIPIQELEARIAELSKYKKSDIVVFCSHSHRSPRASYILGKYGFKKVSNMSGGMSVLKDRSCVK